MKLRSSFVFLAALLVSACSNGPAIIALGVQGSPCLDDTNCDSSYFCIESDGEQFCAAQCATPGGCSGSYACDLVRGVCVPAQYGTCLAEEFRCGPSFDPCCSGLRCLELSPYGSHCVSPCVGDFGWETACCAPVGDGTSACVPPHYCD